MTDMGWQKHGRPLGHNQVALQPSVRYSAADCVVLSRVDSGEYQSAAASTKAPTQPSIGEIAPIAVIVHLSFKTDHITNKSHFRHTQDNPRSICL